MEMHQIRYFLAVAEELNFTRASEKCNVSQPSLSRAIKLLEEELGGPLFHRERSRTHLTELGRMVRPHLATVYDESRAVKRLSQELGTNAPPLKLGIMSTIAPYEIVELIAHLSLIDHRLACRCANLNCLRRGEVEPRRLAELGDRLGLFLAVGCAGGGSNDLVAKTVVRQCFIEEFRCAL